MTERVFSFEGGGDIDDVLAPVRDAAETHTAQMPFARPMTRRVLAHLERNSLDTTDEVLVAPADVFTSTCRFEADRLMMRSVPHVVAWSGEIAQPGSYTTKDVMGTPV